MLDQREFYKDHADVSEVRYWAVLINKLETKRKPQHVVEIQQDNHRKEKAIVLVLNMLGKNA